MIQDQSKDKPIELEMGWLCEETKYKYSLGDDCEHNDTSYKNDGDNNIAVNSAERSSGSCRHSSKGGLTRSDLNSRYCYDDYGFLDYKYVEYESGDINDR